MNTSAVDGKGKADVATIKNKKQQPNQNHQQQQQPEQQRQQHNSGLFQVKKFFGDVASALKEVQSMNEDPWKPQPKAKQQQQQQQQQQQKKKDTINSLVTEERTLLPPPRPSQVTAPSSPLLEIPEDVVGPLTISDVDVKKGQSKTLLPQQQEEEHDWEVLSAADDRASHESLSFNSPSGTVSGSVFVPRAGSVRSITSVDQEHSSHTTLSVPFKIQRTNSSSTLDSQDHTFLGPTGKGILGVDYVEHVVLPTDTLQGICIAYKVSASHLRRANHFSGTLHSAPKKLVIPLSKQALRAGFIRVQDTDTKEYKLHSFLAEYPGINPTEAKAYLELADWELKDAIQSAKEDREWENGSDVDDVDDDGDEGTNTLIHDEDERVVNNDEVNIKKLKKKTSGQGITLKSGQIGIRVGFNGSGIPVLKMKGIGASNNKSAAKTGSGNSSDFSSTKKETFKVHKHLPAIATKSVLPEDLVNAAPQHNVIGFELQDLSKSRQV